MKLSKYEKTCHVAAERFKPLASVLFDAATGKKKGAVTLKFAK